MQSDSTHKLPSLSLPLAVQWRIAGRRIQQGWSAIPGWLQTFAYAVAFLIWLWVAVVVLCA